MKRWGDFPKIKWVQLRKWPSRPEGTDDADLGAEHVEACIIDDDTLRLDVSGQGRLLIACFPEVMQKLNELLRVSQK